ncbi:EamA family transporter RarD [Novosphingobium aquiterrae]|uniref:EamA family transporter RarD n=1 Tax=Novosphingobium aquiterrae TaxID=624388 RepID=A0ABV6PL16_9SPHN
MHSPLPRTQPGGVPMAIGAYLIWGLLPLYLLFVRAVPALEFVAWRIIWTLPFCLAVFAVRRNWSELRGALADWAILRRLAFSAGLIGVNWVVFTLAVQHDHLFAASLGYYINPLVNVFFGTLFLGEKLNRRQWTAVILAALGVSLLAFGALDMLYISLTLAVSFSAYGLVRKLTPVGPLPGLTIESLLLLLPAMAVTAWYATGPGGSGMAQSPQLSLLVALGGVLTGTPLLLFSGAAKRMDYSMLGMIQFMSPTISFVIGLTVFHEPLRPVQLTCFVVIWTAIALFVWDLLAQRRRLSGKAPA